MVGKTGLEPMTFCVSDRRSKPTELHPNIYIEINLLNYSIMTKEQLEGLLRHTLTFVGGILVVKGYLDEAAWSEISGAAISLAGALWSVLSKNK